MAAEWTAIGPAGVTVESLAIDPANQSHAIAGTYFGGLYESYDGGNNWVHLDTVFGSFPVFAIIFDRQQPATLYVGTFQAGVWKSLDSGQTWLSSNNGFTDFNVVSLAIDPYDSSVLIAVTGSKVFRSVDAANSWSDASSAVDGIVGRTVVFDPRNTGRVFLGTLGAGVYVSDDDGLSWLPWNDGLSNRTITALSFSDGGFPRLYAASSDGYGFELKAGASTWIQLTIWPEGPRGPVNQIFPHPQTYGVLLASTVAGIYISRDDGITWYQSTSTQAGFIVADLFGSVLYAAGLDGGLTSTSDLGKNWRSRVKGLQNVFVGGLYSAADSSGAKLYAATEYGVFGGVGTGPVWSAPGLHRRVFAVQGSPNDPQTLFAGTESAGVWKTSDGGTTWIPSYSGVIPERIYAIQASQTDPTVVYAGTSTGVFASADGGRSWNPPSTVNIPTVLSIGIDPQSSLTAYFGSLGGQIYKTTTAGASVLLVFKTNEDTDNITQIKVSPQVSNRVYAITASGYMVVTSDGGVTWNLAGPDDVRVTSVDIDPHSPWLIYVGTVARGVYKSEDYGISWRPLGDEVMGTVYSIAVDSRNPMNLYAGGEGYVYGSGDGGLTWTNLSNGLPPRPVTTVLTDPFNPGVLYTSVQSRGIFVSCDGGNFWQASSQDLVSDTSTAIAIDPLYTSRLYAGSQAKGVFVSEDAATTWVASTDGMTLFVRGIAFDAANPHTMYAGSLLGGVFKSTNQGETWNPSGLGNKVILQVKSDPVNSGTVYAATSNGISRSTDGGATWSDLGQKVGYVFSVAIDPLNRDTVYVGGSGGKIFKSTDRGITWTESDSGLPVGNVVSMAVDGANKAIYAVVQGAMAQSSIFRSLDGGSSWKAGQIAPSTASSAVRVTADAEAKAFYAATNGNGVLLSFDGNTWTTFNDGLTTNIVNTVIGSPSRPGTLYAATIEGGIFVSRNGQPWRPMNAGMRSPIIYDIAADSSADGLLYAAADDGLYRTTNAGETWTRLNAGLPQAAIVSITIDPFAPTTIYASTGAQVFKSSDRGDHWVRADAGLPSGGIQALQIGSDSSVVYAGLLGAGLAVSGDGGQSWSGTTSLGTVSPFALCLVINPKNPSVVYAGTSGGIIKSMDSGNSWISLQRGLTTSSVIAMALDPNNPDILYAGTSAGVYMSEDGGQNWTAIVDGMFHRNVTALSVDATDSRIVYAGTEGGGVFRYVRQ
jgi:photosystem II stability/assembly factor-like uncharacterized protein